MVQSRTIRIIRIVIRGYIMLQQPGAPWSNVPERRKYRRRPGLKMSFSPADPQLAQQSARTRSIDKPAAATSLGRVLLAGAQLPSSADPVKRRDGGLIFVATPRSPDHLCQEL